MAWQDYKKIPYGIGDYKKLQEENCYYVDKTKFIKIIEQSADYLIFLRPRRFGKTLLISMLHYYYDINCKDEFNKLFGNTYIGKNKTKNANSYLVLRFDFSAIDMEDVEQSFKDGLVLALNSFRENYNLKLNFKNENPISMFQELFDYIQKHNLNLYILIDEYDNFANKLLIKNQQDYKNLVIDRSAIFKQFFTVLKSATGMQNSPLKKIKLLIFLKSGIIIIFLAKK